MPLKILKSLFPKAMIELLHATENNSLILKSFNNSSIEQLGVCSVWLKHKDKGIRCRLF